MLSETRLALEHFDNQHDFERMVTDVLNALGYQSVEPMAPSGGPDGGRDIAFRDGDEPGMAFVTARKDIEKKFAEDLNRRGEGDSLIALFCTVGVSPSKKHTFSADAIAKGYRIEFFDVERLRSLLDTRLTDLRRHYFHIEDNTSAQIRSNVAKLLSFPAAVEDTAKPTTVLESHLSDQLPRRLFDLLMRHEQRDIKEVPNIGGDLHRLMTDYYSYRVKVTEIENDVYQQIAQLVGPNFKQQWAYYLRYAILRFAGASRDNVVNGGMILNYGLEWDNVERMFNQLAQNQATCSAFAELESLIADLSVRVTTLATTIKAEASI